MKAGGVAHGLRVLVIDDAREQRLALEDVLVREGFAVKTAGDGESGLELAASFEPSLVVLDLGLPGIDGTEVCRRLRVFSDAYVIMLTARDDEIDKVVGLAVGADDYVTKPYSTRELVARVGAMLRRPRQGDAASTAPEPTESATLRDFGALTIDPQTREVFRDGVETALTRLEFDLLEALSARPTMVFTRAQLIEQVWGPGWFGDEHVVDVHVKNLRAKIDRPGQIGFVKTVRGVGYRFDRAGGTDSTA